MLNRLREVGASAKARLLGLVPERWKSPKKAVEAAANKTEARHGEDLPLHESEVTMATEYVTLDPATLEGKKMRALKEHAVILSSRYPDISTLRELFENIAEHSEGIFEGYLETAVAKLRDALAKLRKAQAPATIDIDLATATLRGQFKAFASKRLDDIDELKAKATKAKAEYRRLTIGITGNPAIAVKAAAVGLALMMPITAAFAVSLYFEIVFNAPILQDQGNWNMAIAFSILVSLAGSITTFMAGMSKRTELNHRNAVAEKQSCFTENGIDPETRKPAAVFPLSGDAKFKSRLWHSLMALVITGTLVIRWYMMTQMADIAGSFGVVLVFTVLYGWEVMFAEVTHPLAAECLAQKAAGEKAETDLKALEGKILSPEAKEAFDKYVNGLNTREKEARTQVTVRKAAASNFARLAHQVTGSTTWFQNEFGTTTEVLVKNIDERLVENDQERAETNQEAEELVLQTRPKFVVKGLPFDLQWETSEAERASASVEIRGRRMTASEIDKALLDLTAEVVTERARIKAETPVVRTPVRAASPIPAFHAPRS